MFVHSLRCQIILLFMVIEMNLLKSDELYTSNIANLYGDIRSDKDQDHIDACVTAPSQFHNMATQTCCLFEMNLLNVSKEAFFNPVFSALSYA